MRRISIWLYLTWNKVSIVRYKVTLWFIITITRNKFTIVRCKITMRFCSFVKSHSDVCIKLQEVALWFIKSQLREVNSKLWDIQYYCTVKKMHTAFQHTTSCYGLHSVFNLIDIRPGQKIFLSAWDMTDHFMTWHKTLFMGHFRCRWRVY